MVFTDEDLKVLRVHTEIALEEYGYEACKDTLALLARLDAAEDAAENAYKCTPEIHYFYNKWRRTAGKGEVYE